MALMCSESITKAVLRERWGHYTQLALGTGAALPVEEPSPIDHRHALGLLHTYNDSLRALMSRPEAAEGWGLFCHPDPDVSRQGVELLRCIAAGTDPHIDDALCWLIWRHRGWPVGPYSRGERSVFYALVVQARIASKETA